MAIKYHAMRELPKKSPYTKGDVFVLIGELFGRGYANGIVDEAKKAGMTIIGTTVGRRDSDNNLRPLTPEELAEAETTLGGKIINIPLEAGFDMELADDGISFSELLKGIKPDAWESFSLDNKRLEQVREKGKARFLKNMETVAAEIRKMLTPDVKILFAHAMAGGIPRARLFMPILNRVFKGTGDKHLASKPFWDSDLGKLCKISFDDVSADTFKHLLDATKEIRSTHQARYTAYGYHGCEVLINGAYTWQSYTPYLQGWAKIRLEEHAINARKDGVIATVYNCPEIQTNSSALFMGVEISLYPLLAALAKEGDSGAADEIMTECKSLLKDEVTTEQLLETADRYLSSPLLKPFSNLQDWPHHSTKEEMELMLKSSAELIEMNKTSKEIVCTPLSRAVFQATGKLIFHDSWSSEEPVTWLNHDVVAKQIHIA